MCLEARKRVSLEARLASLDVEFAKWTEVSAKGKQLQKHHSQIARLTRQLSGCRDEVAEKLKNTPGEHLLGDAVDVEQQVLEVHRLWGYFRAKLELRLVEWYFDYLRAADEFAWRCYEPIQRAALAAAEQRKRLAAAGVAADPNPFDPAAVKEPPLVYLSGAWSPHAIPRGRGFVVDQEAVAGRIPLSTFFDITKQLPIPLVGIPWSQLSQSFDGTIIGHEVGHAVQDDFGLTDELTAAVKAAVPEKSHEAWEAWLREVFADWYGCLATGPAFVGGLIDLIAQNETNLRAEIRTGGAWGRYPTATCGC